MDKNKMHQLVFAKKSQDHGPFHKSSYERFVLYKFVDPVLNYGSNEFVALTNLCETGPMSLVNFYIFNLP